jgi:ankyrin repeat protein
LHKETIAGNKTSVELLLQFNADRHSQTNSGKTALDFARQIGWTHLIPLLET